VEGGFDTKEDIVKIEGRENGGFDHHYNGSAQTHNVSDSSLVVADIVSHVLDDSDKLNLSYR